MTAVATIEEAARVADDARDLTLEEIYESLDVRGHKVEILEGRIVVSAAPIKLHNRIVTWLTATLFELSVTRGWDLLSHGTIELPESDERIQPDLFICPADESTDSEWLLPSRDILLTIEVVSPSSRRGDYQVKPMSCARSGIPLYLLVDPRERLLTLFAGPSERGYLRTTSVPFGDKLELPEPFDVTLDTAAMPGRPAE
jgi:Uma2 family endonuclease